MSEAEKDTVRARKAFDTIRDDRPATSASVLVTLEHTVALALLHATGGDARQAALLLNEGLAPGVENRLALYAKRVRT